MQKTKARNILLIALVLFLCLFGLVMIYSASSYSSEVLFEDKFHFVKKQIFGLGLGIILFIFTVCWVYTLGTLMVATIALWSEIHCPFFLEGQTV